ncbi:hypothetical protein FGB62_201g08 [Gracilaria domingensis]|nr:hypothetical protein FGB62_201g08 [Gracilaria domingensis]
MAGAQHGSVASSVSTALPENIVRQSTPADAISADNRSSDRQGVPSTLHQVSSASHIPRTPRGSASSKPQQIRTSSAVAAVAAAAATAAANPSHPLHSRQIPLSQSKPGLSTGVNPQVLANMGMGNKRGHMSQLIFVHGAGGPGVVSSVAFSLDKGK